MEMTFENHVDLPRPSGVSVIVCCHNSAERIIATLKHLQLQRIESELEWEVILVDNASTDHTVKVAKEIWAQRPVTKLSVVSEAEAGLSHARIKGFNTAAFSFWVLVDDDNWLGANWVQAFYQFMMEHPRVGLCGGYNEAVFEVEPDPNLYFPNEWLALGKPSSANEKEENQPLEILKGALPGAGLGIRAEAWDQLVQRGFKFLASDRKGTSLSSGGDTEMSYGISFLGWQSWYLSGLRLKHYMPKFRTERAYHIKLAKGIGQSLVLLDAYYYQSEILAKKISTDSKKLGWAWRLLGEVKRAVRQGWALSRISSAERPKKKESLEFYITVGRIVGLWKVKSQYRKNIKWVAHIFQINPN